MIGYHVFCENTLEKDVKNPKCASGFLQRSEMLLCVNDATSCRFAYKLRFYNVIAIANEPLAASQPNEV